MWQGVFVFGLALFVFGVGSLMDRWLGAIFACGVFALWGVYHSIHLHRLYRWLLDKDSTVPTVIGRGLDREFGAWQAVFDKMAQTATRQDQHRQKLIREVKRLNHLIANMPSAIIILNKKGKIEWHNKKARQYFPKIATKLSFDKHIDDKELSHWLHQTKDNHRSEDGILELKISVGQSVLHLSLSPLDNGATMLIGYDITDGEKLNISKNHFIANVSHELRTPLTVIQGFLEMMADNELNRELQLEFVGLMQQESGRMLDLIEGLLTLSRLENDQKPLEDAVPVNLSGMIVGIYEEALRLGKTHHITADIAPDIWVKGVQKELYSVFSNLIFNAIRHTEAGTTIDIHLSVGDEIVFFVKDNGEGIDGEHLAHLTERFYRVDKGRSRKTGGSGLGLAIAKHALAHYDGTLHIDSQKNVGSTFKVVMPIKNAIGAVWGS